MGRARPKSKNLVTLRFDVGDRVVVVKGDMPGSHGTIIQADASQPDWPYRVDFDRHITLRPLQWVYDEDELEFENRE